MAKILVMEDTKANLDAAAEQLTGHELTLVNKFSDARKLLVPRWDDAKKTVVPGEPFDIVLTDLFLPGEKVGQGNEGYQFIGEPVPTGFALTLLALKVGIGKVAIVSNGNHHAHPLTWALDALQDRSGADGEKFSAGVNMVLPGRLWSFTGYECPTVGGREEYRGKPYEEVKPLYDIKDWAKVLNEITKA